MSIASLVRIHVLVRDKVNVHLPGILDDVKELFVDVRK